VHHFGVAETVSKVVFRLPPTANLAPLLLIVAATPFAFAAPYLWLVYVVPIAVIVWVLRNRTTADAEGLYARSTFSYKALTWDQLASLKVEKRGKVSAVGTDSVVTPLPGVRLRHLALLSRISDGRVPDPAAE
jgi:Bacterial PH domain